MKVVFICGPFRAPTPWDIEQNIRMAEKYALEIWRMGAAVICPHTNSRFFQGAAPDEVWLEGYQEILARCDAVYCIPGWEESSGSVAEKTLAEKTRVKVFTGLFELQEWIKNAM